MKVLKEVESIQLKLQGRVDNKNTSRTISFCDCEPLDVLTHTNNVLKQFDETDLYTKPISILVKIDHKGFKYSHTAYVRTPAKFDNIVNELKNLQ